MFETIKSLVPFGIIAVIGAFVTSMIVDMLLDVLKCLKSNLARYIMLSTVVFTVMTFIAGIVTVFVETVMK